MTKIPGHITTAMVDAGEATWWQKTGNDAADAKAKEGAAAAMPENAIEVAHGLATIVKMMARWVGSRHTEMARTEHFD